MLKFLIILTINTLVINISFADSLNELYDCSWDNRLNTPCLEISKNLSNSSKFSKTGINKIVISKEVIDRSGAVDVIDVLKNIPDINITQSGPKGQQASIFSRGTGSNHTIVMINGVPINDQSTTQGLHDFGVDFIQTIHQIEIYPGSSATHFGTNSIGGAINIIVTGDFKDNLKVYTDKNANYELALNKNYIYDNSSLNMKFGSVKNKTISARGNSDDEKDGLENYSVNINYEKFLSDNNRLYNTTYIRQTVAAYDNSSTNQTGYEGDNKFGSFQIGLDKKDKTKKKNYIIYYNIYDREYDERGTIDTYESEVIGIKYDFSNILNNSFSYGLGSEYKYDWGYFDNKGSYQASTKGNSNNFSLYGNAGINLGNNFTFSLFTRSDIHKQTGLNSTYKVNLDKRFENFNFGTAFMTGLRNPTLYEMFGTDNFGYSGNKDLKPEKSNTAEIYSNISVNENVNFKARAFRSNIENNIEYINNKYSNDNDDVNLNQSGINFLIGLKTDDISANISSSFLSTKKENGSNQTRRPRKTHSLNLYKTLNNKIFGNYNINLSYKHYGKHYDVHSSTFNTIEMDSTDILDLIITKKINQTNYFLKVSNLLDESYQRPHGYNQENRIIKFGFKY